MREHPEVRLNQRSFSKDWEVVRVGKDGRKIIDRWPLHKDDSDWLTGIVATAACVTGEDDG